jgi:hypothetical protein
LLGIPAGPRLGVACCSALFPRRRSESDVGNAVRTAVDLFRSGCCTTKKWHGLKVPSQLHSVSRPASWAGFPIPSARLARTPGGWVGHGACVEGSPSLLCAPEQQARAVAAFNPTQHQSPAAGRRAAGARGGRAARGGGAGGACVCGRRGAKLMQPRRLAIYYFILRRCGC